MKSFKDFVVKLAIFSLIVFVAVISWCYKQVADALPQLEGEQALTGLIADVDVERDQQGIVTLKAKNRLDIAIATGFVHAQERFFQMDLLRRNSAGELSALFGDKALAHDKKIRVHRFRARAKEIVKQLPDDEIAIVKAYTQGVNQGLKQLLSPPFEYSLLQQAPKPWQQEDTILTIYSMYIDLQYEYGERERTLAMLKSVLSPEAYAFLNPQGSQWDAAIDGSQLPSSPMPKLPWPSASANTATNTALFAQHLTDNAIYNSALNSTFNSTDQMLSTASSADFPGSNNWAVAGALTQTGSAIVANDMHLGIRVPNTWFRARFEYLTPQQEKITVTGATLPGTPNIAVGSNTKIAWGFTNSYGDWNDIIILETNEDESEYLTEKGFTAFSEHKESISVSNGDDVELIVKDTIWGPVIGKNHQGQLLALRWTAHDINAVNMTGTNLEQAKNVKQAFNIAARSGIPSQNFMVADSDGNIGWTIIGLMPKRSGDFGETPTSWASGENKWLGYLTPEQYPKVYNPEQQRLWTANSRVVGGQMLKKIGNGGYAIGARSSQIKQRLFEKAQFTEQDLLAIALDDEALFLKRWQQFLLSKVLTEQALTAHSHWQAIKNQISQDKLSASIDSVAYRFVRNFRLNVKQQVFSILNENMQKLDDNYNVKSIRHQLEVPLWQLVNQQPENFLWRSHDSWSALFADMVDKTYQDMTESSAFTQATWGKQNISNIQHPLSRAIPLLGYWLDMPKIPLAGDIYMPRVQGHAFGASERMVVSPGHEEQGIFQMPTSQAGNPLSPYYGVGHSDWTDGKASAFLPSKTKYYLTLTAK